MTLWTSCDAATATKGTAAIGWKTGGGLPLAKHLHDIARALLYPAIKGP